MTNPRTTCAISISPSCTSCRARSGSRARSRATDLLDVGALPESLWGFNGFFSKKNGGGFLTDHFPLAPGLREGRRALDGLPAFQPGRRRDYLLRRHRDG